MPDLRRCVHCGAEVTPSTADHCPVCFRQIAAAVAALPDPPENGSEVPLHAELVEDEDTAEAEFSIELNTEPVGNAVPATPPLPEKPIRTIIRYWMIIFCASFAVGFVLSSYWAGQGKQTMRRDAVVIHSILLVAASIFISRHDFAGRSKQVLALRFPAAIQMLAAIAVALPLMLVLTRCLDYLALLQDSSAMIAASTIPTDSKWSFHYISETLIAIAELPFPVAILLGALLPALGEELFFRGLIGRILIGRFGAAIGVLSTSLLFALAHMNATQGFYCFFLGVVLHSVYLGTRSLWTAISLHAFNNFFAFLSIRLQLNDRFHVTTYDGTTHIPMFLFVSAAFTAFILLWFIWRTRTTWLLADGTSWSPGFATAEAPPPESGAEMHRQRATAGLICSVVLAHGLLAAALLHTSRNWIALTHSHRAANSMMANKMTEAQESASLARQYNPHLPWPIAIQAWLELDRQDLDTALRLTEDAMERNPTTYLESWLHAIRGNAYLNREEYRQAIRSCSESIDLDPTDLDTIMDRAAAYEAIESYESAVADYDRVIRLAPDNGDAYRRRASALAEIGDHARAIADCEKALQLTPSESSWEISFIYGVRGQANLALDHFETAVADLTKAIDSASDQMWLYYYRGLAHQQLKRVEEGIDDLNSAIALSPDDMSLYRLRGELYLENNQLDLSISDFTTALEEYPRSSSMYEHRATAYERSGESQAAAADRASAVMHQSQALIATGREHLELDRYHKALLSFDQAIEVDPENVEAYMMRAHTFTGLGDLDQAVSDYSTAISLNKNQFIAYRARGQILIAQESFAKGVEDLSVYLERFPDDETARWDRARAYRALGREEDAMRDEQAYSKLTGIPLQESDAAEGEVP